ncbi:MAG TPA: tRNA (adenosine(37)-N6)-threonylcarbamoyltransferase complex ATPase subunit type 1 TsaE [Acidobacteriota bacterium]
MQDVWDQRSCVTSSAEETVRLGRAFAETLRSPSVVLLHGELGAGKTTFTRGLVNGLGAQDDPVRSPTFTLVNPYSGNVPIYHVDLYRVDTLRDLETIGMDEISNQDAIVIVEWGEKLRPQPESGWKVIISDLGGERRKVEFSKL